MAYTGQDILPIARSKLGQNYVLGARAPLMNPQWNGPWDCAEFTSWCAYQAYKIVFGVRPLDPRRADAYSGFWCDDAAGQGTLIGIPAALATPGAFLIRKPREGLIGHVALCAGGQVLVEAAGAAIGVVERPNTPDRRWDLACLLPGVSYAHGAVQPLAKPPTIYRVESPYMRGPEVEKIQKALAKLDLHPGEIDGIYGELTEVAVAAFQRIEGLIVDGEVGPRTADALGL